MDQSEQMVRSEVAGESFGKPPSYDEAAPTLELPAVRPFPEQASMPWVGPPTSPGSSAPYQVVVAPPIHRSDLNRRQPAPLGLRLVVVLLAICIVASTAGFVTLHERPAWFAGLRNMVVSAPARRVVSLPRPVPTSTLPSSVGAGDLVISSLEPATGSSGAQVTIIGSHLFGPGGYLAATFNGSPVPTRCPSESECTAVAPPASPGHTATVRVETHIGISNGLTFHYR